MEYARGMFRKSILINNISIRKETHVIKELNSYIDIQEKINEIISAVNAMQTKEEPNPEPKPEKTMDEEFREWTTEERKAAEHPRVGDRWSNKSGADWRVKSVSDREVSYYKLFSVEMSNQTETIVKRGEWVENLHRDWRSYLVSRGPEPKAEKPVMIWIDGDVIYSEKYLGLWAMQDPRHRYQTFENDEFATEAGTKFLFNILDLAAAVKEYGLDIPAILDAVQRGEKVVTLTKEEIKHLTAKPRDAYHYSNFEMGIWDKFRAAIGGGQ
jgi:hypothetical protein